MKTGAWLTPKGEWHWIDDHADWIRRPACAQQAGLSKEAARRLAAMPRRASSGPERTAILLEAMSHGLIRFRGHGGSGVTFESTLPLEQAMATASAFMAAHLGPLTLVRFNTLPDGPCVALYYQELEASLLKNAPSEPCPSHPAAPQPGALS